MTLPIIENPLYGQIQLKTTAWSTPFSWVDRTADIVGGITYSEGGRLGTPGSSQVDVGTLNVTFKNLASVPAVGHLVELSVPGAIYDQVFTGYVQDVSQRVVFDQSVSYTTPVTLTTIHCVDWVGYISQFQALGVGGSHPTTGVDETDSYYQWDYRVAALNKIVDSSYATKMIYASPGAGIGTLPLGDTDMEGTLASHLDLLAISTGMAWRGSHTIPTNKTTGRTSLIDFFDLDGFESTGITFTDVVGTAGQLHYTEIDFENSTQNIANTIVANNRVRFNVTASEVTKIGGFNEENYVIVNSTPVVGIGVDSVQQKSDSTSITTYGIRQADIYTNIALPATTSGSFNLVTNPSMEYDDTGWSGSSSAVTRRRKPTEEAAPFSAAHGLWAMKTRIKTAVLAPPIVFSGGESDGIPVVAGNTYYLYAKAARGTDASRTDSRARSRVAWYNADETVISTVYSSQVSLTTSGVWYDCNTSGLVAPAGAVRATVAIEFNRSGGANFTVGDSYWADAFKFGRSTDAYFDGDTAWTSTNGYIWTGGVGASMSYKINNGVDNVASQTLTQYSTTSNRVYRIRWNAQEDLEQVGYLMVGNTISVKFGATTNTYRIVGIDGTVDAERFMIDYYLAKV